MAKSANTTLIEEAASGESWMIVPTLLLMVPVEDLAFRSGLIGLPASLFGRAPLTLALLVVGSSLLFALTHVFNYARVDRRLSTLLLTCPQLLIGVALALVYLRYGLLVTIAVHFVYDVAVLAVAFRSARRRLASAPVTATVGA